MQASEAGNRVWASEALSGPAAGLPAAVLGQHSALAGLAVLRSDDTVLGADPASFRSAADRIGRSAAFAEHLGEVVSIGASLGLGLPDEATSADDLLRRADLAMFDAKRQSRRRRSAAAGPQDPAPVHPGSA